MIGGGRPTARRALRPVLGLLPRRADYAGLRRSWPRDLAAGVTVGVVALPLALGFGVASGVGPAPGLATAVVAAQQAPSALGVAPPDAGNAVGAAASAVVQFAAQPYGVVLGLLALAARSPRC